MFGLSHYPEKNKEEQWKRFIQHLNEKYSTTGYIKLWISGSENEEKLYEIRKILLNKITLRQIFNQLYEEEIAE